jgi:TRAP-type C4-dicarboxylate transport system permease small subunit
MLYKIYDKFEESIALIFFLLIFGLMTMGVFNRYLFGNTFAWNIELCRYSFVWLTFVGAAFVRKQDAHIKIEILFNYINRKLSPGSQKAIWVIKEILTIAFLIQLIYFGFILANKTWRFKSQAMQIPQFFLYISVTVGAILYLLREIPASFRYYREHFFRK